MSYRGNYLGEGPIAVVRSVLGTTSRLQKHAGRCVAIGALGQRLAEHANGNFIGKFRIAHIYDMWSAPIRNKSTLFPLCQGPPVELVDNFPYRLKCMALHGATVVP